MQTPETPNEQAAEPLPPAHGSALAERVQAAINNCYECRPEYIKHESCESIAHLDGQIEAYEQVKRWIQQASPNAELSDAGGQSASASQKDVARPHSLQ